MYQSWFVLHCGFKRKLVFIIDFDLVMQTCFFGDFNTQLLRYNLEKKNFAARLDGKKKINKTPSHTKKNPSMILNRLKENRCNISRKRKKKAIMKTVL